MKKFFQIINQLAAALGFNQPRLPGEKYYIYGLLFFIGYLLADISTLYIRGAMLPSGGIKGAPPSLRETSRPVSQSYFSAIEKKNIFNSDHQKVQSRQEIADPDAVQEDGKPVKTSLPLELIGTIVHGDNKKSVATVMLKGDKKIEPYKVGETINDSARIIEVLREQVIFINTRTQKKEFIEIVDDSNVKMGLADAEKSLIDVPAEEPTEFTFNRTEIDQQLENLPAILQDAKAVPYIVPGTGGEVGGFKLVAIKPGSIYEKLGLKRGDILQGVNGEKVDSPQKAMELYQALKSAESISLEISRGGTTKNLNYQIR